MNKIISLFTGAGGLDLGFERADFETGVAVEMDLDAVGSIEHNRPWPVIDRDIHDVPSSEILETASLRQGDAEALIGGPPCQPFSKSGYWSGGDSLRLEDPRAGTLGAYLRVLRDTLPKTFLLENVPGLAFRKKSEGLDFIKRRIDQINQECGVSYSIFVKKLNAADFGVPQTRERVFVIGCRSGGDFNFPDPTHGDSEGTTLLPVATAWDALADIEEDDHHPELQMRGKWADLLASIPEGHNYLHHTDRGDGLSLFGWRRRYWSFLLKLSKRLPSWTLQAQPGPAIGPFHWKSRRLSARELARLQTFPDDYQVIGDIRSAQKQIGNAVPSALAEILARQIRIQLLSQDGSAEATLMPKRKTPIPPPEEPLRVHPKYLGLVGQHEAHPGTGKGYAASQRDSKQEIANRQLSVV